MTYDASQLLTFVQAMLWSGFVVFLRVGAMLALVPAFGEQTVPVRVRLGLSIAFSLVVLPAVSPGIPPPPDQPTAIMSILLAEVVAGLLFGMMLRLFVIALMMAGTLIAQSTSLSQLFGGSHRSKIIQKAKRCGANLYRQKRGPVLLSKNRAINLATTYSRGT